MRKFIQIAFLFNSLSLAAQTTSSPEKPVLPISRTTSPVQIDGQEEDLWQQAQTTSPFLNKWPLDSGFAEAKTEVKMMYDDQFIYLLAVNYQEKNALIIPTLKRDQLTSFWKSDGFSVVFDPLGQKNNGFLFGLNAGGAQLEGAVSLEGASVAVNENWDNKWFSSVRVFENYWVCEMAIPFSALRFENGRAEWRINFIRSDMTRNQFSTWSKVPQQLMVPTWGILACCGGLER
jgi:hypothetical protein